MESRIAFVEQIARTTSVTLERIEREPRVMFGRLLGVMASGFTMMLAACGALLRVIADGFDRL
jgi:hypothetical protein